MKNLTQKTSRKPKKTKKPKNQYSRTLGKGKMQKSKKPRENQKKQKKNKKNKKNNIPGLLEKEKCKNQKNLEKTKKKQKKQKNNIPELLSVDPISKLLEYCFFCFFLVFSRFFGFLHFYFCKSPGILFFCFFWFSRGFFGFLEVFFFLIFDFRFLLLQESWNIVFSLGFFWFSRGFLVFFLWHSQTTGANTNKTCKEVGFCLEGTIYISGRDFPGRISAGTKLTCNSFLIQCKFAFILINVYFSLFFSMVSVLCAILL